MSKQNADGSWPYGEGLTQRWIDNFHTGYNLVALKTLSNVIQEGGLLDSISRGFNFYVKHFFLSNGIPKYYHDKVWPIDIHSVSQSIVTLCELSSMHAGARTLASRVCLWALSNMQSKEGYFYYQKTRFYKNKISYMRWSQAWMLYALALFLGTANRSQNY